VEWAKPFEVYTSFFEDYAMIRNKFSNIGRIENFLDKVFAEFHLFCARKIFKISFRLL